MIYVEQFVRVSSPALMKSVLIPKGTQASPAPVPGGPATIYLSARQLREWAQFYSDIAAGIEKAGKVPSPKEVAA